MNFDSVYYFCEQLRMGFEFWILQVIIEVLLLQVIMGFEFWLCFCLIKVVVDVIYMHQHPDFLGGDLEVLLLQVYEIILPKMQVKEL